ncbi:Nudix hydrolase 2-like protein [Drosera capensis]
MTTLKWSCLRLAGSCPMILVNFDTWQCTHRTSHQLPVNCQLRMEHQVVSENGVGLLPFKNDNYNGIIVELEQPMEAEAFRSALRASMTQWRRPEGFWYHHAEPSYLMLVNWLPESTCTLPANASHRVGVGVIVVNDKRQILAVQENSGAFRGTGIWKIPTGVVDEGEDIWKAAVREVKEETGWMPLDEFAVQPIAQKPSLFKCIVDLCITKFDKDYTGFSPRPVSSTFEQVPHCLYLNSRDLSQSGSGYST